MGGQASGEPTGATALAVTGLGEVLAAAAAAGAGSLNASMSWRLSRCSLASSASAVSVSLAALLPVAVLTTIGAGDKPPMGLATFGAGLATIGDGVKPPVVLATFGAGDKPPFGDRLWLGLLANGATLSSLS